MENRSLRGRGFTLPRKNPPRGLWVVLRNNSCHPSRTPGVSSSTDHPSNGILRSPTFLIDLYFLYLNPPLVRYPLLLSNVLETPFLPLLLIPVSRSLVDGSFLSVTYWDSYLISILFVSLALTTLSVVPSGSRFQRHGRNRQFTVPGTTHSQVTQNTGFQ